MDQYNIRITNNTKIVLTLVLVPLLIVPAVVFTAVRFPGLPDWAVMTGIFTMLALIIALTIFVIKKISPRGILSLYDDGFSVDFLQQNMFTPKAFTVKTSDIKNFFAESKGDMYSLSFTTAVPPYKFNIEAGSKDDEDLASFAELMARITEMVANNNTAHKHDARTIAAVSMYERGWAKVLAVSVIIIFIMAVGMNLFMPGEDAPEWWRFSIIIIFGVPFLYKVYDHNYGKNTK